MFNIMPFLVSLRALIFRTFWLVVVTVITIFVMVAVLPFCRKRENLWLFVLVAVCAIPINIFLLTEYPIWTYLVYSDSGKGVLYHLAFLGSMLVAVGVEEVVISVVGRKLWRRQVNFNIK